MSSEKKQESHFIFLKHNSSPFGQLLCLFYSQHAQEGEKNLAEALQKEIHCLA